jgi:lipopolysaccharide/colanic/teichoic acid biosynthesis glycosyltransferase
VKRIFDVAITLISTVITIPLGLACAGLILICDGRPIFYSSVRQVGRDKTIRVLKFRTMRRDADKIFNRDTVPVAGTRFLNAPPDSPLFTPIGRLIEGFGLTELPQLLHVFHGTMSLVGNRPLPRRVMEVLCQDFHNAGDRFATKAGLTGVVQLVGRDQITDADRLAIEIEYCRACLHGYSMALDLWLLINTVLILGRIRNSLTVERVCASMRKFSMPAERIHRADLEMASAGPGRSAPEIGTDVSH